AVCRRTRRSKPCRSAAVRSSAGSCGPGIASSYSSRAIPHGEDADYRTTDLLEPSCTSSLGSLAAEVVRHSAQVTLPSHLASQPWRIVLSCGYKHGADCTIAHRRDGLRGTTPSHAHLPDILVVGATTLTSVLLLGENGLMDGHICKIRPLDATLLSETRT